MSTGQLRVFAERSEALGADGDAGRFSIRDDCGLLDVRPPNPVGPTLGVADVVAELKSLVADFALCH
jgi:hypothetical protein